MPIYFVPKDKKARDAFSKTEFSKFRYRFMFKQATLNSLEKYYFNFKFLKSLNLKSSCVTRMRNRCLLTGRSGSIYRLFKISRIQLKTLGLQGNLVGLRRSSW